jgi:hypothetical protein
VVLTTPPRKKLLVTKPHTKIILYKAANVLQELYSHGGGRGKNTREKKGKVVPVLN